MSNEYEANKELMNTNNKKEDNFELLNERKPEKQINKQKDVKMADVQDSSTWELV